MLLMFIVKVGFMDYTGDSRRRGFYSLEDGRMQRKIIKLMALGKGKATTL